MDSRRPLSKEQFYKIIDHLLEKYSYMETLSEPLMCRQTMYARYPNQRSDCYLFKDMQDETN